MTSDTTSFILYVNNKSNKSLKVKFIIAISKNSPPLLIYYPFPYLVLPLKKSSHLRILPETS